MILWAYCRERLAGGGLRYSPATERTGAMCKHEGFYTCVGRYDRSAGRLVYFMVCDECQKTLDSVLEQPYEPHYVDALAGVGRSEAPTGIEPV
jgi:hypothetical protein